MGNYFESIAERIGIDSAPAEAAAFPQTAVHHHHHQYYYCCCCYRRTDRNRTRQVTLEIVLSTLYILFLVLLIDRFILYVRMYVLYAYTFCKYVCMRIYSIIVPYCCLYVFRNAFDIQPFH